MDGSPLRIAIRIENTCEVHLHGARPEDNLIVESPLSRGMLKNERDLLEQDFNKFLDIDRGDLKLRYAACETALELMQGGTASGESS